MTPSEPRRPRQFVQIPSSRQRLDSCYGEELFDQLEAGKDTPSAASAPSQSGTLRRRKAIILILFCTILGAGAQLLLKVGSRTVETDSLWAAVWSMALNFPLILGLSLYGLSTVLFIHALRNEQLSLLYPLISLTYIWVTIVSVVLLGESVSLWKIAGVTVIVSGVALLGKDNSKP